MRTISAVPDLLWTEQARREISRGGGDELIANSIVAIEGDGFILGWCQPTLLSPPWFWFAAAQDFRLRSVVELARQQRRLPAELRTAVERDYEVGHRFASFFGFRPTWDVLEAEGVEYIVYRRA